MVEVNKNEHKEAQKTVRRLCEEFGLTFGMLNRSLAKVEKVKKKIFYSFQGLVTIVPKVLLKK
tara:strand:+ start:817 stop:1005 length:189 start_codon:yes stop_codon:yes gene_type:complete